MSNQTSEGIIELLVHYVAELQVSADFTLNTLTDVIKYDQILRLRL